MLVWGRRKSYKAGKSVQSEVLDKKRDLRCFRTRANRDFLHESTTCPTWVPGGKTSVLPLTKSSTLSPLQVVLWQQ